MRFRLHSWQVSLRTAAQMCRPFARELLDRCALEPAPRGRVLATTVNRDCEERLAEERGHPRGAGKSGSSPQIPAACIWSWRPETGATRRVPGLGCVRRLRQRSTTGRTPNSDNHQAASSTEEKEEPFPQRPATRS